MNKVILNGESILSISDLHKELKKQLGLPDYYGENLDALWDCLTGWVNMPLVIEWKHVEKSRVYLGDKASAYLQLFREAEEELDGFQFKTDES
ncbi:barstar family protein [Bacillus swezeyi]|uniref:barstar family protein n=1 Tax=Bacillus swezeyi TaxID=1925020 RepID=UPI002E2359ED|nr:barstar family protein [Bacillus swezeyi]